jgi:hypothetical protein
VGAIDGTSSSTPPHYQQITIVLFNCGTRKIKKKKNIRTRTNISTIFQVPQNKKRQSDKKFAKLLQNSIDSLSNNVAYNSTNLLATKPSWGHSIC